MQIRIPKELHQANIKALSKPPFEIDTRALNWYDHTTLNLAAFTVAELEKLKKILYSTTIRGAGTIQRDITNWIHASSSMKGLKQVRARSTKQAFDLVTEYIRRLPNKHLYERVQAGNEGVSLAYYVYKLNYYERRKDEPESFSVSMAYEEFGIIHKTHTHFNPGDVIGRSPHEILINKQLFPETPGLRSDYEFFLELYAKWRDKVGVQFLAVGKADDEGIDGNEDDDRRGWWRSPKASNLILDANGEPARVVVDVFREGSKDKSDRDADVDHYFWRSSIKKNKTADDEDYEDEEEIESMDETLKIIEIPIHPYLACFDLKRHLRLRIHAGNLTPYEYDTKIHDRLVLPSRNQKLIDTLLVEKESKFKDIIKGKSGGTIILCQGKPGTGKTLTAEVYSESLQRPLYTVQCSQLGTDPDTLEENLMKVLARGRRWGAVMLLDEADVYVHERGSDLDQNAIVGVFLRVLEYHAGVLFLTTNRGDLVDDAILSRCTARVPYDTPTMEEQERIWGVIAEANAIELNPKTIKEIVKAHPKLSGRDIKNLLKLASMVAHQSHQPIDAGLISEIKVFKPTSDD